MLGTGEQKMENLNAEQIKKALECCATKQFCAFDARCSYGYMHGGNRLYADALALINSQEQRIKELEYTLEGVMHFVDKWLDGAELEKDEVNRAITMREKTLQIVERLTEENERLRAKKENNAGQEEYILSTVMVSPIADTVQRYKSAIVKYYSKPKYQPTREHPIKHTQIEHLFAVLDQIAKEMLEGEK